MPTGSPPGNAKKDSAPLIMEQLSREWHVVQLKPGGLRTARINLARQDFPVFCPMELRPSSSKRKPSPPLIRPLFPGYLFVSVSQDPGNWRRINGTRGVSRLLTSTEGQPASMPREVMSSLMRRTDEQGILRPPKDLAPGTEVRILSGAFSNWLGRVAGSLPNQRYLLLLEMMGRQVRADVAASELSVT